MNNIRFALRSLARSKSFVVLVVLSLGFALGVNTTMYTVIDATIHPWTPLKDPDHLFTVSMRGDPRERRTTHLEQFRAVRESKFYQSMAVSQFRDFNATIQTATVTTTGRVHAVSPNFFDVVGVPPLIGRTFVPSGAGDDAAVILSNPVWRRLFPGRDKLDGAVVEIGDRSYTVVGVMPIGMSYPYNASVWVRLSPESLEGNERFFYGLPVVRLAPGTTPETAQTALTLAANRLTERYGSDQFPFLFELVSVRPRSERINDMERVFAGAGVAVLLIACSNLANMMLARGLTRRRELALKLALGASRWTLVWQLTTEALILAGAGAGVGLLVASWGNGVLRTTLPDAAVRAMGDLPPALSFRVYLFAVAAAGFTALLFGLIPAWRVSNVDVSEPLKDSAGTTTGRTRGRLSLIVMAEVGICMALLFGGGTRVRDLVRIAGQSSAGLDPHGLFRLVTGSRDLRTAGAFDQRVLESVRRVPGVVSVTAVSGGPTPGGVVVSDFPGRVPHSMPARGYSVAGANYLATMRMPILVGRDFEEGDAVRGAVIVDAPTARQLWPHVNPVGRTIKLGGLDNQAPWYTVVGVTGTGDLDVAENPDDAPDQAVVYVTLASAPIRNRTLFIRASGGAPRAPTSAAREVRMALSLPYTPFVYSFDASLEGSMRYMRQLAGVFVLFGLFALLLASVGLYGVLAYTVSQRMREFAVRSALGAGTKELFELVLRDGVAMIVGGLAMGLLLSTWLVRLMRYWSFGFNVGGAELWLVGSESLLAIAALIACAIPARRATRANPVDILRAV